MTSIEGSWLIVSEDLSRDLSRDLLRVRGESRHFRWFEDGGGKTASRHVELENPTKLVGMKGMLAYLLRGKMIVAAGKEQKPTLL